MTPFYNSSPPSPNSPAVLSLLSALQSPGLCYLHFPPQFPPPPHTSTISDAFSSALSFFQSPSSLKSLSVPPKLPPGISRGYLPSLSESGASQPENKQSFSLSSSNATPPNIFPPHPSPLQPCLEKLYSFFSDVLYRLFVPLEKHLPHTPPIHELISSGASDSLMRVFFYHQASEKFPEATGSSPHTDWGLATLIAQSQFSDPALHFRDGQQWKAIPPIPNTLVLNCGDYLAMTSDGELSSPEHLVHLTNRERLSFVFFQYPPSNTPIPKMSEIGIQKTKHLSILKDQSRTPSEMVTCGDGETFGELISRKWTQVSR